MYQGLVEHLLGEELLGSFNEYGQMTELNWRHAVAAGITAASLSMANPSLADAKPLVNVTQAEQKINVEKLMNAIKHVESSGGVNKASRYEKGVEEQLRKRFDKLGQNVKEAIKNYGYKAVASSYGPWQILASTAYDLGYKGAPADLSNENVSKDIVLKYVQKLINSSRTKDVQDVVSAYNAGLGGIHSNPDYVKKVMRFYGG